MASFHLVAHIALILGAVVALGAAKYLAPPVANQTPKHCLRLVSLFSRHADRGPATNLPEVDGHRTLEDLFWPDGVHNLTDAGRLRALRVGLENGRHYRQFIGLDANKVMAFSSTSPRCIETAKLIVRGMLDNSQTKQSGLRELGDDSHASSIPGSGSELEWQRVKVDIWSVPSLTWRSAANCRYYRLNPPPVDENLLSDPEIRSIQGIEELRNLMLGRYQLAKFGFDATEIYSVVMTELRIARTRSTYNYTSHFRDWVNRPASVPGQHGYRDRSNNITLYDALDYATLRAFVDRYEGGPRRKLAISPTLKHLFDTQDSVLSKPIVMATGDNNNDKINETVNDKRLALYVSHDDVLTALLHSLGVVKFRGSFERRFYENLNKSDLNKYLNGVQVPSFGLSFRLELYEVIDNKPVINQSSTNQIFNQSTGFAYVKMSIYNRDDPASRIRYITYDIGTTCRSQFMQKNPKVARSVLETEFYPRDIVIDRRRDCPLKLLRNITADLIIPNSEWSKLC